MASSMVIARFIGFPIAVLVSLGPSRSGALQAEPIEYEVVDNSQWLKIIEEHDNREAAVGGLRIAEVGLVGLLISEEKLPMGTAFLVGPSSILTAAHCIAERRKIATGDTIDLHAARFLLGYVGKPVRADVRVTVERMGNARRYRDDWAILRLDRDIGNEFGWITPMPMSPSPKDTLRNLLVIGYGGGRFEKVPGIQFGCVGWRDGPIWHHCCDTWDGTSGAPLLIRDGTRCRYIGVHVGGFPPPVGRSENPCSAYYANVAVDCSVVMGAYSPVGAARRSE